MSEIEFGGLSEVHVYALYLECAARDETARRLFGTDYSHNYPDDIVEKVQQLSNKELADLFGPEDAA